MSVSTLDHRSPFRMALDTPADVVDGEVVLTAANLPGATAAATNTANIATNTSNIATNTSNISANLARLDALKIPTTSGAPGDTPDDNTVRFDPATGILYIKATAGWVSTTLT